MDIPSFLRRYPPFDDLDDAQIDDVIRHSHIEFFPAGAVLLQQSGEPSHFLYVVRTGAVELRDGPRVLDLLGEGEVFGQFSLLSGLGPTFTVRALEDTICYLIEPQAAAEVMGTRPGLSFLSRSLRRREIRAVEAVESGPVASETSTVGSLVRRSPVTCSESTSVRDAARVMAGERVSSLLIKGGGRLGILTDRDLRARVLAPGRSLETAVSEVMSSPVETVPTDMTAAEVILRMLELGVHHFPVVDGDGEPIGVVTDTDLMGLDLKTPFALKSAIERSTSEDAVVEVSREIPEAICSLVDAGAHPLHVARIVAVTRDAIARRLIELAMHELGDPLGPWAWLAFGSEARYEQALFTDQDHGLAYDLAGSPREEIDAYFARLAERVTTRIEETGIRRCRAGVIASNREWRGSVPVWVDRFRSWMEDPGRAGSAFTGIAFDFRRIAGPLDVEAEFQEVIRRAPQNRQFIAHLIRGAVEVRPPTGFFRDLVVEAKGAATNLLDIKHWAITPITNIARSFAIAAGVTENRTLLRLGAAAELGRLEEETRLGLEEAFEFLWQIRLEHQAAQVRGGKAPDDEVDPRALGPLTRQGIKEAFRMIGQVQEALAAEAGLRR
jgi:CBS domain-containing protein